MVSRLGRHKLKLRGGGDQYVTRRAAAARFGHSMVYLPLGFEEMINQW